MIKTFGQRLGRLPVFRSHRAAAHRPRISFAVFCAALLIESTVLQLGNQLVPVWLGSNEVAASDSTSPTGSVANPTPPESTAAVISTTVIPEAQAASAPAPTQIPVILRSPLRSYRLTQYFSTSHNAIDMAAPSGTPIYASAVGTVAGTGYLLQGGGLMVKVTHPNGFTTYYAHMSKITSSVGQHVDNNTQIGLVGMTGWATGPHLHFIVDNAAGRAINPLSVIK